MDQNNYPKHFVEKAIEKGVRQRRIPPLVEQLRVRSRRNHRKDSFHQWTESRSNTYCSNCWSKVCFFVLFFYTEHNKATLLCERLWSCHMTKHRTIANVIYSVKFFFFFFYLLSQVQNLRRGVCWWNTMCTSVRIFTSRKKPHEIDWPENNSAIDRGPSLAGNIARNHRQIKWQPAAHRKWMAYTSGRYGPGKIRLASTFSQKNVLHRHRPNYRHALTNITVAHFWKQLVHLSMSQRKGFCAFFRKGAASETLKSAITAHTNLEET